MQKLTDSYEFQDRVVKASYDELAKVKEQHYFACFVWDNDDAEAEPLMIDATTANAMVLVHDALNEKNQRKFREWVGRSRAHFVKMMNFSWSRIG
jgi:molybdopterin-guanine dinucleotide biosynthesis protein A